MKKIPLTKDKFAIVDDEDFDLVRKYSWRARKDGNTFYAHTTIHKDDDKRKGLLMHRLIMNPPNALQIDHQDRNGLNNQRNNLRVCTRSQNLQNQHPREGGTSRFKGVCWHERAKKWMVYIRLNGKRQYLSCFTDEIEAAKTYDTAAKEHFGEFARLNFPQITPIAIKVKPPEFEKFIWGSGVVV